MSDDTIKKLVVTAIALTSLAVWILFNSDKPSCVGHCVTDISAQVGDGVPS